MYDFGVCPQCRQEISEDRLREAPVVCNHCGYTAGLRGKRLHEKLEKKKQSVMVTFSAGLVAIFVGLAVWDSYLISAIPLQAKKVLGMASAEDYESLYLICEERQDLDCQLENLKELSRYKNEALAVLGKKQMLLKKYPEAEKSLAKYFEDGGISLDASYDYARVLEKQGNVDMAGKYYQSILDQKPETLQITVTKRYIKMLLDGNKKREAKRVLASIRKKGDNTAAFMEMVFKEL